MTNYYDIRLTITVPLVNQDDNEELVREIDKVVKTDWYLHDDGVEFAYSEDNNGVITEAEVTW